MFRKQLPTSNLFRLLLLRFKLTAATMAAEKSVRLFPPTNHQNAFKLLFLASFCTPSQKFPAATY